MEKNKNVKKGVIIGLIICTLVLLSVLGTYAYFIINVSGQNQNVTLNSGTLALVFEDGNPGINESLDFGSSIEKIFTIENTGTLDAWAKINFEDLINTYLEGSLTYSLSYKKDETEEYSDLITNENVPISKEASTKHSLIV